LVLVLVLVQGNFSAPSVVLGNSSGSYHHKQVSVAFLGVR
jgi:hypothetical protein